MHCRNQSCVSLFVVPTPCLNYSERWRPLLFSVLQYQPPPEQEFTEENSQLIGFHSSGNEGRLLKSYSLEKYQRRCCTLFRIPLATQVELETSHWLSTFGWIHTIQDSLSAIAMQWPDIPCFFLVFFWQLCLSSHHSSSGAATHPNVSRTLCPGCWAAAVDLRIPRIWHSTLRLRKDIMFVRLWFKDLVREATIFSQNISRYWLDEYTARKYFPMFLCTYVCHDV